MLQSDILLKKTEINNWVYEQSKGIVQAGPFVGMKILPEESWPDGNLGTKLLGCYEQELHEEVEQEIARLSQLSNPKIVNIGCAEGYYAIGLARRLPNATIWVIDTSDEALRITRRNAAENNVKLIIGAPLYELFKEADLVFSDCEGAERAYLDKEMFPGLLRSTLIIECHDSQDHLMEKFKTSHAIKWIVEGARDPNKLEMLWGKYKSSMDRWIAVSEGRPCIMDWFVMRPLLGCKCGS